jgi:hypothetical protein
MRVIIEVELHAVKPTDDVIARLIENLDSYTRALRYETIGGDIMSRTRVPYRFIGQDTVTAEIRNAS